jgi:hypothetical protein
VCGVLVHVADPPLRKNMILSFHVWN